VRSNYSVCYFPGLRDQKALKDRCHLSKSVVAAIVRLKQPWEDLSRYCPLFIMFYSHHPHQKISTTLSVVGDFPVLQVGMTRSRCPLALLTRVTAPCPKRALASGKPLSKTARSRVVTVQVVETEITPQLALAERVWGAEKEPLHTPQ
jgi:hypothetical protein